MRVLFLLLVGANLALFAWSQYWATPESASDREPLRRQVSPEKIRVLSGKDLAGLPAATQPRAIVDGGGKSCLEWGGFAVAEAPRAEQALAQLALGERLTQARREETAGWWVYLPPQGSRAGAAKKVAELKGLGIDEYFIVPEEGRMQSAVSLGVFSTEEAARSRLEALRARGVRTAQIGERETRVTKVWFQVRSPEAVLQAKLRDLAQGFPGTELRDCQ
jgi:hypothetical protein